MNNQDPYIGQVIFNAGADEHDDTWDDSELIDYWDKAKEAYKKRQDQQTRKTPPFSTHGNSKRRIEKRIPLKKKNAPSPLLPQQTSAPPESTTSTPPQRNDDDIFTQMIMSWYYAGYYTGLYLGGSDDRNQ